MNTIENIKERFNELQSRNGSSPLTAVEQNAFATFNQIGIPTTKNEEWKYTRINTVFNKKYAFNIDSFSSSVTLNDVDALRLPDYEAANELVFVNGLYSESLSTIRSQDLEILPLEKAAQSGYAEIVNTHLGHSSNYLKDGVHALNTAFLQNGIFIYIRKGQITEHPIYFYHITDARSSNILSQPRCLVYVSEAAQVQMIENFVTLGKGESFSNGVMEIVVEKEAIVDHYKIQADAPHTNQVSTTHFHQVGKSVINTVTISLDGGIVRNNLNIVMDASFSEAHMYGLYFLKGETHVDNHTVVDNVKPNCESNEMYKGVMDDASSAVFNGKIFVQQLAQKTNAFQSNKNVLLSDAASVNTKPQLEIFADDVKCSHGCTVGQLDEEALFYLRSRGVNEKTARSLLVHAFAVNILEHIKSESVREYVDALISERLEYNIA